MNGLELSQLDTVRLPTKSLPHKNEYWNGIGDDHLRRFVNACKLPVWRWLGMQFPMVARKPRPAR